MPHPYFPARKVSAFTLESSPGYTAIFISRDGATFDRKTRVRFRKRHSAHCPTPAGRGWVQHAAAACRGRNLEDAGREMGAEGAEVQQKAGLEKLKQMASVSSGPAADLVFRERWRREWRRDAKIETEKCLFFFLSPPSSEFDEMKCVRREHETSAKGKRMPAPYRIAYQVGDYLLGNFSLSASPMACGFSVESIRHERWSFRGL